VREALWAYSEANWQEIKQSLEERGVELDAVTVSVPFVPGERWWPPDPILQQRPLRDALQIMARYYCVLPLLPKPLTPIQHAEVLREAEAAFEKAREMLARTQLGDPENLYAGLTHKLAEVRRLRDKLTAKGSRSAENAHTLHNDCWREFARLWRAITPSAGKLRRKQLGSFLVACTKPLFPNMTAQEFDKKLDSFISNFFKSR
jgi:hypothetical protein